MVAGHKTTNDVVLKQMTSSSTLLYENRRSVETRIMSAEPNDTIVTTRGRVDAEGRLRSQCPHGLLAGDHAQVVTQPRGLVSVPPDRTTALLTPAAAAPTPLRIPRVNIQTNFNRTVPPTMRSLMQKLIDMNPTFAYRYFSDDEAMPFAREHCGARVWRAMLRLRAGAFRADLWRYCVLWSQGGVYIDTDFEGIVPLDAFLRPDDEFVVPEDNHNDYLFNAFMASTSKHPLAYALMMEAVRRVEFRHHIGSSKRAEMRFYHPRLRGETYNDRFLRGDIYWSNRAVATVIAAKPARKKPMMSVLSSAINPENLA